MTRQPANATSQDVANLYRGSLHNIEASKARVKFALKSFVDANDNPGTSPNYVSAEDDPMEVYVDMLQHGAVRRDATWILLLLRALKILSRKQSNRLRFGPNGLRALVCALINPLSNRVAAEGANVLLNVCYEISNVHALLDTPVVQQLILFLLEEDEDLQANAAGAIQSICFQEEGRRHVHSKGGIPALITLLTSENSRVVTRAVGALHNLSSTGEAICDIRATGGIPLLVQLLRSDLLPVSASAAGALQNVSREVASRLIIRELDAVPPLARLLSAPDVQAQVCAAGALLNIVGPDLDAEEGARREQEATQQQLHLQHLHIFQPYNVAHQQQQQLQQQQYHQAILLSNQQQLQQQQGQLTPERPTQRRGLGRIMALCMATAAIYESMFDEPPPPLEEL